MSTYDFILLIYAVGTLFALPGLYLLLIAEAMGNKWQMAACAYMLAFGTILALGSGWLAIKFQQDTQRNSSGQEEQILRLGIMNAQPPIPYRIPPLKL